MIQTNKTRSQALKEALKQPNGARFYGCAPQVYAGTQWHSARAYRGWGAFHHAPHSIVSGCEAQPVEDALLFPATHPQAGNYPHVQHWPSSRPTGHQDGRQLDLGKLPLKMRGIERREWVGSGRKQFPADGVCI